MKKKDLIIALFIVIIWGANFTVIKLGLAGVPPMLLVALRYITAAFPAIFFVKKPEMELKYIIAYGFTVGVGQFSLLFYAMSIGMPAGVSSIVLQAAAFFTPIFAAITLGEKMGSHQIIGLGIAAIGLFLIGANIGVDKLTAIPTGALLLTVLAAALWATSNIIVKFATKDAMSKGKKVDMLSMVVWSSLIPPIPVLILASLMDSPQKLITTLTTLSTTSILAVLYLGLLSTLFGYGMWSVLLSKYPASKVAPLSLLVPIIGLITAQLVLGEKLTTIQWAGGAVIVLGLLVVNFGNRFFKPKEV